MKFETIIDVKELLKDHGFQEELRVEGWRRVADPETCDHSRTFYDPRTGVTCDYCLTPVTVTAREENPFKGEE